MIKMDIQAMINKYKTTKEGINALGFLSYHTFDKEKIAEDYESINAFFRENFDLNHRVINYQGLLKDAEGSIWLEIATVFDLELLDELIAFAIAADIFEENLTFRYEETYFNIDIIALLNEDPESLEYYDEEEYLKVMKRRVLPTFKSQLSYDTLARYEKDQLEDDLSIERKRELLLSWWEEGMKDEEDEYTLAVFKEFLNDANFNRTMYLVYKLYSQNETSLKLSEMIKRGAAYSTLIMAGATYYHSTPEAKKEINAGIKAMFAELNKMDQKKKRLI